MPIQTLTSKSVTAGTWVQLGTANYPAVPGTLIISSATTVSVGGSNSDAAMWAYCPNATQPIQVYVPDISAVWIKGDQNANIYLSYYPATETPVPMR